MLLLGIETSCDETSVAVVEDGWKVHSCSISSSRKEFEKIGGVIPEQAARKQLESMLPTLELALHDAGITPNDLHAIAVTQGPGLLGSLLVGTTTASVLGNIWKRPVIPVHHTLGHLFSTEISKSEKPDATMYPIVTLSVSGGHTDLWLRTAPISGMLLGSTRDDAAGEAFDKGAVLLGLPYPGGPELEKMAKAGDEKAHDFPEPLKKEYPLEFSFSGLKTSLKYLLAKLNNLSTKEKSNVAASYQRAIVRHLVQRVENAIELNPSIREVHVVGGVSANGVLRESLEKLCTKHHLRFRMPETLRFCTDNAAMIAAAGYALICNEKEVCDVRAQATLGLEELLQ